MNTFVDHLNEGVIASLKRSRLPEPKRSIVFSYAENLSRNNLPIIFSLRHLATSIGLNFGILRAVAFGDHKLYRTFTIPKRSGGTRTIDAPSPTLLHCQRWISKNILCTIPVSDHAHGFLSERSIKSNAAPHIGCQQLLHVDISDFFPSIKIQRIVVLFKELGYSPAVSFYLARICCKDGRLTQGAATSPNLSNLVFRSADHRLSRLAGSLALRYTRYADDITFSGDSIGPQLITSISNILAENGFALNKAKTRHSSMGSKKMVTGLSISSGKVMIPKKDRRALRLEIHLVKKLGVWEAMKMNNIKDPVYIDRLRGRLEYWRFIQPEDKFVLSSLAFLRQCA